MIIIIIMIKIITFSSSDVPSSESIWQGGDNRHAVQIHDLKPGNGYYFRVRGSNSFGVGHASMSSSRNRYYNFVYIYALLIMFTLMFILPLFFLWFFISPFVSSNIRIMFLLVVNLCS